MCVEFVCCSRPVLWLLTLCIIGLKKTLAVCCLSSNGWSSCEPRKTSNGLLLYPQNWVVKPPMYPKQPWFFCSMASTISCTATCAEMEAKCFHAPHADQAYFLRSLPWTGRSSTTIDTARIIRNFTGEGMKMTWMKVSVESLRKIIGRVWKNVDIAVFCSLHLTIMICFAIRLRLDSVTVARTWCGPNFENQPRKNSFTVNHIIQI